MNIWQRQLPAENAEKQMVDDNDPIFKTDQNYYDIVDLYGARDMQQYINAFAITHDERDSFFGDEENIACLAPFDVNYIRKNWMQK